MTIKLLPDILPDIKTDIKRKFPLNYLLTFLRAQKESQFLLAIGRYKEEKKSLQNKILDSFRIVTDAKHHLRMY